MYKFYVECDVPNAAKADVWLVQRCTRTLQCCFQPKFHSDMYQLGVFCFHVLGLVRIMVMMLRVAVGLNG